ncbi:MAG: ABC transporter ATP-binding protein [Candidatus Marinimicrobia bacterium]|nr:ABC transporter ATP-binding protein [Candidatus Neomarinimicrobiota bacterium]MCF7829788.1 ABC transporter ATP-binding protein [Candidatus Neomarinimicrobiota bacterium]MCF7881779.1 ABC transporter ATP-binding protein [Candidatus Neomarinimicrobiota bacterium]
MNPAPVIRVSHVTHRYDTLTALDDVSFTVDKGEIYGLLGPNGGGKSTLFKILSTNMLPSSGELSMAGIDLKEEPDAARSRFAVIFQHPSLDDKLSVYENLRHHGWCHGLSGEKLKEQIRRLLEQLGLSDRNGDRVEDLSGGMRRKTEIAKGLLTKPQIIFMDEPSTGLDPGARRNLWDIIKKLNQEQGITFVVTTHLMDEAEHCDSIGILDRGEIVVRGKPEPLKAEIGSELVEIQTDQSESVRDVLHSEYDIDSDSVDGTILFERADGHSLIPELMEKLSGKIQGIAVRQPTLDDVFLHFTGHRFEEGENQSGDVSDAI